MRKFKYGERVIYAGSSNTWTFEKDLLKNYRGTVYQLIEIPGSKNYMVEFENGLHVSIDQKNLRLLV